MLPELSDATAAPAYPVRAARPSGWQVLVDHRGWQRLLAGLLTGNLDPAGAGALRAHVRDCSTCRGDLAQLAPVVAVLPLADPARLVPSPPAPEELYRTVARRLRRERARAWRATLRRRVLATLGTLALLAALAGALLLLPTGLVAPPSRGEAVPLHPLVAGVNVLRAELTPRPWGLELGFTATGLAAGERYQVAFVTATGTQVPAGGVLGAAGRPVTANLSGPLHRPQATQILVTTPTGKPILHADLLGAGG